MTSRSNGIGEELRAARIKLGRTQVDVAESAGLTQQHLSRIECGRITPSVDTLCRLADALGVTVEYRSGRLRFPG